MKIVILNSYIFCMGIQYVVEVEVVEVYKQYIYSWGKLWCLHWLKYS